MKPSMLFMHCTRLCFCAMQVLDNTWRMCHNHVDPACLAGTDADMCVFQDIQELLAAEQQQGSLSGGEIAGVVIGGGHWGLGGLLNPGG